MLAIAFGSGLSPARVEAQTPAATDARRVVLLLTDSPSDPFASRIRAEIASLGLDVIVRAPQGSIEESARAAHAVAAIQMLPSRTGVEVWMADATSGRSLLRQRIVDETPGGPNQTVIALQTAELLRTSLFPHPPREAPRSEAPSPHLPEPPPPPTPTGESELSGGLGLLHGAGGATAAWQAELSYRYMWNRGLGVAFNISVPILRGTMSGTEGSADVGAVLAGGALLAHFKSEPTRLTFTPGLGAAFVAVLTSGHPDPAGGTQLVSASSTAYTGIGYACATVEWRATTWFGLGLRGLAGATPSRVRVRFAGNDAGAWGTPVLGATLFGAVSWR